MGHALAISRVGAQVLVHYGRSAAQAEGGVNAIQKVGRK
jgi:hypothetical protein